MMERSKFFCQQVLWDMFKFVRMYPMHLKRIGRKKLSLLKQGKPKFPPIPTKPIGPD